MKIEVVWGIVTFPGLESRQREQDKETKLVEKSKACNQPMNADMACYDPRIADMDVQPTSSIGNEATTVWTSIANTSRHRKTYRPSS